MQLIELPRVATFNRLAFAVDQTFLKGPNWSPDVNGSGKAGSENVPTKEHANELQRQLPLRQSLFRSRR
jgi:hypothetical protein